MMIYYTIIRYGLYDLYIIAEKYQYSIIFKMKYHSETSITCTNITNHTYLLVLKLLILVNINVLDKC